MATPFPRLPAMYISSLDKAVLPTAKAALFDVKFTATGVFFSTLEPLRW